MLLSVSFSPLLAPGPPAGSDSTSLPPWAGMGPGSSSVTLSSPRALRSPSPVQLAAPGGQAGLFWLEPARAASLPPPLPCAAPRPQPCSRTAARTAFPFPGFNHVTSPLGRPESVPVALYVKSQFLTLSIRIFPHGPPSCLPHLRASSAELLLPLCKTEQPLPPLPHPVVTASI